MTKIESLDVEMGICKGDLRKPNWITRFKNTDLVKWVILQGKLIQKRCVNFPLILILCLLYSDAYPNILSVTDSLIISSVITFITCLKKVRKMIMSIMLRYHVFTLYPRLRQIT